MTKNIFQIILQATDQGCNKHLWCVEGGALLVERQKLLQVLESAYDSSMPDWVSTITEQDFQ